MTGRGRGRGGAAKRPVLPNIAAADLRLQHPPNGENAAVGGRGGQRGRGARGGARGGAAKPQIVQSAGIFAEGVGDGGNEEIVGKIDGVEGTSRIVGPDKPAGRRQRIDSNSTDGGDTPAPTFESEWLSDEEADREALEELCQASDFIADLKKGREIPLVLPVRDNSQFADLVRKPPSEAAGTSAEQVKKEKASQNDTCKPKKRPKLLHFKLPASFDILHQAFPKEAADEPMDAEPSTVAGEQTTSLTADPPAEPTDRLKQEHCMDGLPVEEAVGKLQVLKSGKVRLVIGGRTMDVHPAIPSGLHHTVVEVQPNPEPSAPNGEANGIPPPSNGTSKPPGATVTVLGEVGHAFLCTYDVSWRRE
ncbi:hypothetical protein M3Y99_00075500 [Aphelenchoides fujianensis]|nr:hypothetical protein M3Y99_00075500 [Aphelenchoides fujianensis]